MLCHCSRASSPYPDVCPCPKVGNLIGARQLAYAPGNPLSPHTRSPHGRIPGSGRGRLGVRRQGPLRTGSPLCAAPHRGHPGSPAPRSGDRGAPVRGPPTEAGCHLRA
ncbi:hypothetical protein SCWH03_52080 [Streptomyces pacificus]|uniref:Uncharacterized protein n=1 Tax=Streptomyces pacificus TaxID=2705029 RepID=A0A6A0B2L0_9ACTN|nr:hypothetical protein SCWH03_52080 [Streptomyces pacificus]